MLHDFMATARIAAQVILALTFAFAAVSKLRHSGELVGVVQNYRLLPEWAVEPAARILPWLELAVAVCLLLLPPAGAAGAAFLLAVFAVAMAVNLRRGRAHIDCGCGQSTLTQRLRWALVVRNAALLLLAPLAALPGYAPSWSDVCSGVACGVAIQLVLISANTLMALGPTPRRRRIRLVGGAA